MFPPYPREMKTNTAKFKSAANCSLLFSMEMVTPIPTRALSHARGLSMRTHLTTVDLLGRSWSNTKSLRLMDFLSNLTKLIRSKYEPNTLRMLRTSRRSRKLTKRGAANPVPRSLVDEVEGEICESKKICFS